MNKPNDEYLGDGVYASFDGYQIVLDTREQLPVNTIAIEPDVWRKLVAYAEKLHKPAEKRSPPS